MHRLAAVAALWRSALALVQVVLAGILVCIVDLQLVPSATQVTCKSRLGHQQDLVVLLLYKVVQELQVEVAGSKYLAGLVSRRPAAILL